MSKQRETGEYEPSMNKGRVVVTGGCLYFFGEGETPDDRPDICLLHDFSFEDAKTLRDVLNNHMLEYIGLGKQE